MTNDVQDWETPCPKRDDKTHCTCWYDGGKCCSCGAPESEEKRGEHPVWGKRDTEVRG